MTQDNSEELLPMVDEVGNITGAISRGEAHNGNKTLHPVVHLHLFNSNGELYLQHRPKWKTIQPDKWDTACGGHINLGECVEDALIREVKEELGIEEFEPVKLGQYIYESKVEKELIFAFRTLYDKPINPSKEELDGGRFWSIPDILDNMGKGIFTPNFEEEYTRFFIEQ